MYSHFSRSSGNPEWVQSKKYSRVWKQSLAQFKLIYTFSDRNRIWKTCMAYLHCRKRTQITTRIQTPNLMDTWHCTETVQSVPVAWAQTWIRVQIWIPNHYRTYFWGTDVRTQIGIRVRVRHYRGATIDKGTVHREKCKYLAPRGSSINIPNCDHGFMPFPSKRWANFSRQAF